MVLRLLNRTRSAGVTMLLLAVHFGRFVWQGKSFYRESSLNLSLTSFTCEHTFLAQNKSQFAIETFYNT